MLNQIKKSKIRTFLTVIILFIIIFILFKIIPKNENFSVVKLNDISDNGDISLITEKGKVVLKKGIDFEVDPKTDQVLLRNLNGLNIQTTQTVNKENTPIYVQGDINYQIFDEVYEEKNFVKYDYKILNSLWNVSLKYPQIQKLEDKNIENKVNELLKKPIFEELKNMHESSDEFSDQFTLDYNYQISLANNDIISVRYDGSSYVQKGAYPNNNLKTINIDLSSGEQLDLNSLVSVDSMFISYFLKIKEFDGLYGPELNTDLEKCFENTLWKSEYLMEYIKKADFYLTENSLSISLPVIHACGDHAEFKIPYDYKTIRLK